jgi:catalase
MAIRFQLPGGTSTDIVAQSYNGFPARDVPEFLAFLRALGSSGPGVEKPTPLDGFLADHPAAKLFVEAPKPMPQSFATESYYAVDAFQFVNRDRRRQPGRYRVVPIAGEHHLQSSEAANHPGNYLFDELRQRLQSTPVQFRLVVQLPTGADPIDDPTRLWPEDRQQKELGILTITKLSADSSSIERGLGFDPARLTDGIEPGDPLIEGRSAVYDIAVRRRGA